MNLNLKPNLELNLKLNLELSMKLSDCLHISLQIAICRLQLLFADCCFGNYYIEATIKKLQS